MKFIIGDIHANTTELKKLLRVINIKKNDELIFLGDYLGKNIYTKETLALLELLTKKYACVFIKGNHDFVWDRYLNFGEFERKDFLLRYGDTESLRQFFPEPERAIGENKIAAIKEQLKFYVDLLPRMVDFLIVEQYLVLHAGITPEQMNEDPLRFKEINYFLRLEEIDTEHKYLNKFTMVAGHTFLGVEPTMKPGYINIDLGAGYGHFIGCLCVEKETIFRSDGLTFKYPN